MFKELSTSLKAQLYERVSSPILGSLTIFWLIFNWDGLAYFVLSEAKIEDKLTYIAENYSSLESNVFSPLLYSSIFCIVYPLISFVPFYIWEQTSSKKIKLKNNLSMSEPLSVEKSIAIRKELLDKENKIRQVIIDHNSEKDDLKKLLNKLTQDNERLYKVISKFESIKPSEYIELNEDEKVVLGYFRFLEDNHQYIAEDIIGESDVSVEHTVSVLNSLDSKGLLKKSGEVFGTQDGYEITNAGRRLLAEDIIDKSERVA